MERGVVGRYAEAGRATRVSEQLCVFVLNSFFLLLLFAVFYG